MKKKEEQEEGGLGLKGPNCTSTDAINWSLPFKVLG